jgi:transcriptional regulator with XRE-family HTH domain
MPPRKAPTARQRRLGTELRKSRERAGLSLVAAAGLLGTDRTSISNTESGRFGVSRERVFNWCRMYGCSDTAYMEALAGMAGQRGKGWWEEYRGQLPTGALDLAELEHHAYTLRAVQITQLPGLLQTEDYARAVFTAAVPELSPVDIRRRLSHRLRRRDVLDRQTGTAGPPDCVFLLHEAALRTEFGGRKTAVAQLTYLLAESERDNVTVRVVPIAAGGLPDAGSSTLYARGPTPRLDTVRTDVPSGPLLLDSEADLAVFRAVLDRVEDRSLDPRLSQDFIRRVLHEM